MRELEQNSSFFAGQFRLAQRSEIGSFNCHSTNSCIGLQCSPNLPDGQAFCVLIGVSGRAGCWNWAARIMKPQCCVPAGVFFSTVGRPVLPLSISSKNNGNDNNSYDRN